MELTSRSTLRMAAVLVLAICAFVPVRLTADHAWGYHWRRPSPAEVVLGLGNNVSGVWSGYLATAGNDWDQSFDLDVSVVPGAAALACRPKLRRIEVCNAGYGNTGWLGLTRVWVSGLQHIVAASAQLNDTYFINAYDTSAWRQFVMCQQIGHVLGLDQTDDNPANPNEGTCMDQTREPAGGEFWGDPNTAPNPHDYDELAEIYGHLDLTTARSAAPPGVIRFDPDVQDLPGSSFLDESWGDLLRSTRTTELYRLNLGNGNFVFTFVLRQ